MIFIAYYQCAPSAQIISITQYQTNSAVSPLVHSAVTQALKNFNNVCISYATHSRWLSPSSHTHTHHLQTCDSTPHRSHQNEYGTAVSFGEVPTHIYTLNIVLFLSYQHKGIHICTLAQTSVLNPYMEL